MGYSDIGCFGSEIQTPNLDSLAASGIRFRNFYTTARCSPSRASLLTGRYPHAAGVGQLDSNLGAPGYLGYLNQESATIAEILGEDGYLTAMTGKWHVGSARPHWPIDRGFARMFSSPNGGGYYFRPFETANRPIYLNENLVNLDAWENQYNDGAPFYSTDAFTTMGIEFIDEALQQEKPFFLYLAYIAPHFPLQAYKADVDKYLNTDFKTDPPTPGRGTYADGYNPVRSYRFGRQTAPGGIAEDLNGGPGEWQLSPQDGIAWNGAAERERYMALYAASVDRMDQQIGKLLAKLDDPDGNPATQDSIANNTIVVFVSDNGGEASGGNAGTGQSGSPGFGPATSGVKYGSSWANVSNTPFRRFKGSNQQGGILAPMIVRWPAGISRPGNAIEAAPAHLIDLVPTVLDAAEVPHPDSYAGLAVAPPDGLSLLPLFSPGGSITRGKPLFFEHEGERAVIDEDGWKLMSRNNAAWELYFLPDDPQELANLAAANPARVTAMADIWFDWAHDGKVKDWPPGNLPRITLSGTQTSVSASGPIPGEVRLSRSSSTGGLDVHLASGGTATPGIDYAALPSVVSFPGGTSQQTLGIVPPAGAAASGPVSLDIRVKPRYEYIEPADAVSVWINSEFYDQWAARMLPGATATNRNPYADPDLDGTPNFVEFARGTDPLAADRPDEEILGVGFEPGSGASVFSFLRGGASREVAWSYRFSEDLENWWTPAAEEYSLNSSPEGDRTRIDLTLSDGPPAWPRLFGQLAWEWQGAPVGGELVRYEFNEGAADATTQASGVDALPYNPRTASFPNTVSGISSLNGNAFLRSSGTTGNSLAGAINGGIYHEVSVDFSARPVSITSIQFDHLATASAPFVSSVALFMSTDGFAAEPIAADAALQSSLTAPGSITAKLDSLPPSFGEFDGILSLRIYFWDDVSDSNSIHRIDNLVIHGITD